MKVVDRYEFGGEPFEETEHNLADGWLVSLSWEVHLQRNENDEPIPVLGSPRNLQFHAREGHRDKLCAELETSLEALDPLVFDREQIIEGELFGDREPSGQFEQRCPDLLVVPRNGFVGDDGQLSKVGMHGGLHPDEMLVPFAAARVDTLQREP